MMETTPTPADHQTESGFSSVVYVDQKHDKNLTSTDDENFVVVLNDSDDTADTSGLHDSLTIPQDTADLENYSSPITSTLEEAALKDLGAIENNTEKTFPTFVEILVEADEFLKKSNESVQAPKEKEPNELPAGPDVDLDNPIELRESTIVVVNGKKCILRTNPTTGQMCAYPTIEQKRYNVRPRKSISYVDMENGSVLENSGDASHERQEVDRDPQGYARRVVTPKRKRGRPPKHATSDPNPKPAPLIPGKVGTPDLDRLQCERCGHQSYFDRQKQEHLISAHSDVIVKCKVCHFASFTNEELVEHYQDLHPKNFCQYCGLTSEKAFIIKRHLMRHTKEGCECPVCGKVFKDSYIKDMHVKMIHLPVDTVYQCSICQKKFNRRSHLTRHIKIHESDKAYKCPYCDYRAVEKGDVSKHLRVHEEPTFFCDICMKPFRHAKNRDIHIKRHNQQKDYKCGLCDFYGYTFTDIKKHIDRTHSENSPLCCDKCLQSFNGVEEFSQHKQTCMKVLEGDGSGGVQAREASEMRNLIHSEKDVDLGAEPRNLVMDGEHFMPDDHWTMADVASAHAPQSYVTSDNGYHQILADDDVTSEAGSQMDIQT